MYSEQLILMTIYNLSFEMSREYEKSSDSCTCRFFKYAELRITFML